MAKVTRTIRVDDELWQNFKVACASEGILMSNKIEKLIKDSMDNDEAEMVVVNASLVS